VLILLVMTLVGLPLAHILFPRLPSRGYLLAKPLGLLAFSFVSWLLLFTGAFANGRSYQMIVLFALVLAALAAYRSLPNLAAELRARQWQIILGEAVFAVAFLLFALYRARNPDIAGTEKPMEFAMLSSVMRSPTFPPIDPWLSGLPVNYYYFGYSMGGALANLAGTAAAIAFNLSLITVFALTALVTFSLGHDLLALARDKSTAIERNVTGGLAAVLVLFAGNLAGYRFVIEPDFRNEDFWRGIGWNASRVLQSSNEAGELLDYTINEFPAFSFVLGDLHPHVMALPFTMLATAIALSWFLAWGDKTSSFRETIPLAAGTALLLGALNVINPWDFPSFAVLVALAGLTGVYFFGDRRRWTDLVIHLVAVVGLSLLLYIPYHLHFEPFISQLGLVSVRSAVGPFVIIFGFWIVAAVLLLAHRLGRDSLSGRWMVLAVGVVVVVLWVSNFPVGVLILCTLLAAAMAYLGVRRSDGEPGRAALPLIFFAGFGLAAVPEIVFVDDFFGPPYERMNTVFKIYFQAWPLLAVASAPALYLFLRRVWRRSGETGALATGATALVAVMFFVAVIYPFAAGGARIAGNQPATLDGLAFARRNWPAEVDAVEWLRAEAPAGSVVLEAVGNAYTDFARVSAWTGIPTVIGWDQHEALWRGDRQEVDPRVVDVDAIYQGRGRGETLDLLHKYDVRYVFVGRLEREKYGLDVATRFTGFPMLFEIRGEVSIFGVPLSTPGG